MQYINIVVKKKNQEEKKKEKLHLVPKTTDEKLSG